MLVTVEWMKTTFRTAAIAAVLVIAGMASAQHIAAHANATGIVKERMDNFKATQGHLKAISRLLGSTEFDEIASRASWMRDWGAAMVDAFPEGSGRAPSEAAPAIWSDNEGFVTAVSNTLALLISLLPPQRRATSALLERLSRPLPHLQGMSHEISKVLAPPPPPKKLGCVPLRL